MRYSRSHSVTKSSSHLNRAIGIFKRTVRRQRSFGIHRSAADGALHPDRRGAYVVRSSLASRALGHGLQDVRRDVAVRAGTDALARPAARTREGPWSQPLARSNYNDLRRLPQDAPPSPAGLRTAGTLPTPAARPTSTGSANGRYPKSATTTGASHASSRGSPRSRPRRLPPRVADRGRPDDSRRRPGRSVTWSSTRTRKLLMWHNQVLVRKRASA